MKRLFLLLALSIASCSCNEKSAPEPDSGSGPAGYDTHVALQSAITHVQPMTGIVLWNTSGSNKKDYVQLEFSYMLYNTVCKEKDVFDWSPMDNLLKEGSYHIQELKEQLDITNNQLTKNEKEISELKQEIRELKDIIRENK